MFYNYRHKYKHSRHTGYHMDHYKAQGAFLSACISCWYICKLAPPQTKMGEETSQTVLLRHFGLSKKVDILLEIFLNAFAEKLLYNCQLDQKWKNLNQPWLIFHWSLSERPNLIGNKSSLLQVMVQLWHQSINWTNVDPMYPQACVVIIFPYKYICKVIIGRCVSSWWPWFPSRNSVLIYMYIYVYIPYTSSVIGRIYNGSVIQYWRSSTPSRSIGECAVPGLNAILCFLWFTNCVLLFDNNLILGCLWHWVFV